MNAGTASGWIDSALEIVHLVSLSGEERSLPKSELTYSYREQHYLRAGEIIWSATLQLQPEAPDQIKQRLADAVKRRKAAQPIELPSCGSVFRNPEGHNAWKLIADCGLRGLKQGGARISEKHCNFIVNEGGATRADVLFLIQTVKEKVYDRTGIQMQQEVILLEPKVLR